MESKSKHFPNSFYRVSVKGLYVKDERILLVKEPLALSGEWELPGGGLDFNEMPEECLIRELQEETGLAITSVARSPLYVWTHRFENRRDIDWFYSLVLCYRIELASLDFKKTEECEDIRLFSKDELKMLADLYQQSKALITYFNPEDFK